MIGLMDNKILSEESFNEMYKVHSLAHVYNGIKVDYTLGFYKIGIPFTNIYSHGGNNHGFTAFFVVDPKKKWGFVLFTNSEFGEELGGEVLMYTMAGPDKTKLYLLVGVIILSILTILFVLIRWLVRLVRKHGRTTS